VAGWDEFAADRLEAWFAAASVRRSRRAYDGTPADAGALDAVAAVCEGFRPHADARVELVREPTLDVFTGIIGNYGKVKGAPHILAFIIRDDAGASAQQHAGYTGEAVVLEATALGLDTCWVGGFFNHAKIAKTLRLHRDERVVAVSPLGTATGGLSTAERVMRGMAGAHERKPLEAIAPGAGAQWPAWALAAVEAARIAPSAVNRQPWRFRLDDGALVVARDTGSELPRVTKALDCGIAMLHAELAARSFGASGAWTDVEMSDAPLDVARYEPDQSPGGE